MEKKVMSDYTLYCTEEQTRKALELGAPITFACHRVHNLDGSYSCEIKEKNGEPILEIPTAEQMIGFLEEQGIVIILTATHEGKGSSYTWIAHICFYDDTVTWISPLSRKEAILAAIDAALEYLSKNKEE